MPDNLVKATCTPVNDDYCLTLAQGGNTFYLFGDAMTMLKVADVIMTRFAIENEQRKHEAEEYFRLNSEVTA